MDRHSVLIVEDEPDLAQALSDDLNEMGYAVSIANNGREALAFIQNNHVDMVLSDLNMPYMSGTELIKQLRLIGFTRPFIVLSGFGSREEIIQLLQHGAFNFLQKPVEFETLKSAMQEAAKYLAILNESSKKLKDKLGVDSGNNSNEVEEAILAIARMRATRLT